jgi:hypothetical protein
MLCHLGIPAIAGPAERRNSQQKLSSFERENPWGCRYQLLCYENSNMGITIENFEKILAICREKSSFKIEGCTIFTIINHIFFNYFNC